MTDSELHLENASATARCFVCQCYINETGTGIKVNGEWVPAHIGCYHKYMKQPIVTVTRKSALAQAQEIIHGDREKLYGHPAANLKRIAAIWSAIFGITVTTEQVAWAMVGVKMSREVNRKDEDNLTDAIGYLALIDRCRDKALEDAQIPA